MTYNQLLETLRHVKKKDALLLVNDGFPVEARLGYIIMEMTRYDNGKLVETKPDLRVNGVPMENLKETTYLSIISTPANHGRNSRPNTLDIRPIVSDWINYLENLPSIFLNQELIFYSRHKEYGSNKEAAMKGGIGFNCIGILYDERTGRTDITTSASESTDRDCIYRYSQEYKMKPYYWGESIIFDMIRDSYYNNKKIYNPREDAPFRPIEDRPIEEPFRPIGLEGVL